MISSSRSFDWCNKKNLRHFRLVVVMVTYLKSQVFRMRPPMSIALAAAAAAGTARARERCSRSARRARAGRDAAAGGAQRRRRRRAGEAAALRREREAVPEAGEQRVGRREATEAARTAEADGQPSAGGWGMIALSIPTLTCVAAARPRLSRSKK